MESVVCLNPSHHNKYYLKKLGKLAEEDTKTYKLITTDGILKSEYTANNKQYLNIPGAPPLMEGSFRDIGYVKSIRYNYSLGYIITFE